MADCEVVGLGGADEPQDAVGPCDLDDEAEVEARSLLERLDPVEEGSNMVASILISSIPRWAARSRTHCSPGRSSTAKDLKLVGGCILASIPADVTTG